MRPSTHHQSTFKVASDKVKYNEEHIEAEYEYQTTVVEVKEGEAIVKPVAKSYTFRTQRDVGRVGTMIVGLGGNNGLTDFKDLLGFSVQSQNFRVGIFEATGLA